jgi:hypothetical protein
MQEALVISLALSACVLWAQEFKLGSPVTDFQIRYLDGKALAFIFVNANRSEPASEVRDHAPRVGFPFPVYKDPGNAGADRFDAQLTPESYVIDSAGTASQGGVK